MKQIFKSLRACPNGYYLYYLDTGNVKWIYFIELLDTEAFVLKAYKSEIGRAYNHSRKRFVSEMYLHSRRHRSQLIVGDSGGYLFEIDEGKYMLEMAEDI